jgi:hypothetical protein
VAAGLIRPAADHDVSAARTGAGEPFEVCVNRSDDSRAQAPLDAKCPAGTERIPGMLMAFAVDLRTG